MKNVKKKYDVIFKMAVIIVIALFSYSLAPKTLQNDTYYTVSIGNLIIENGIDNQDHFSWHENLPYTYPHWLYDVLMAKIYNIGEAKLQGGGWQAIYISVCVLSIILGILIYEVNKKFSKNSLISTILTLGVMYLLKDFIAARAQLVTFILFVLEIFFIEKFLENSKNIFYGLGLIILSILIANLHAAVWPFLFVLALPYIAEYFISIYADCIIYRKFNILFKKFQKRILKNKKNKKNKIDIINKELEKIYISNEQRKRIRECQEPYKIKMNSNKNVKWLILVFIICALAGFLTPLGTTPYTYLFKTMQGNTINNINEHLPLTLITNLPIMCSIVLVLALLIFTKVKIRLCDLFMIGGLTYLMFSSRRQATMFAIIGSFILNRMIAEAIIKYDIKTLKNIVLNYFLLSLIIIITLYYSSKIINQKRNNVYVSYRTYPVEACDWILSNLEIDKIRLYNEYNYGSYILYRGIPVFIDSRADLYSPEFNGRNDDIFMDFINTSNIGKYYGNTFEQYKITHIILYKNAKIAMLIDRTEPENYNKIYSDDNFVIYEIINK